MQPPYAQALLELIGESQTEDTAILRLSPTFGDTKPDKWVRIVGGSDFASPYMEQVALFDCLYHCFRWLIQRPQEYERIRILILKALTDSRKLLEAKDS